MSKKNVVPELQEAHQLLLKLAAAFADGTWAGVHRFAETDNVFETFHPPCTACGFHGRSPLTELMGLLASASHGVNFKKAHTAGLSSREAA